MSFNPTSIANLSDSDDKSYEAGLARRRAEVETLLRQQEEKERLERQARKEAKVVEQKRLEEETQWREEDHQQDLAIHLEVDHVAAVEQQWRKNWMKTFLPPSSPLSNEKMNLIDLPPLTKRQHIRYLPQETPEARQ